MFKPNLSARNAEIYRRRLTGEKLQAIATWHGITRERVRQIVARENLRINREQPVDSVGEKHA